MSANRQFLSQLPFRPIDFSIKPDKFRHDQMVKLVEEMLELHKRLSTAKTPQEKTSLERQIAATDSQIDHLVYDLYDLTPQEIAIVEGQPQPAAQPSAGIADETRTQPTRPKRDRLKKPPPSAAPSSPPHPAPTPEQAWADAAHFYSAKEEPTPYGQD